MLQNVSQGQKLSLKLINNIIDSARGQMTPSDGEFINTNNGTLYIQPENLENKNNTKKETSKFLQCKINKVYKLESRPFGYVKNGNKFEFEHNVLIQLGKNKDDACELIKFNLEPVKDILLINTSNPSLNCKLSDEILRPASDDNSELKINSGFVNTGIAIDYDSLSQTVVYGKLFKNKDNEAFFVICDSDNVDDQVKSLIDNIEELKEIDSKKIFAFTNAGSGDRGQPVQCMLGSQDFFDEDNIVVDSEVEEAKLSSLGKSSVTTIKLNEDGTETETTEEFYEIYKFDDSAYTRGNTDLSSLSVSQDEYSEFILRTRKKDTSYVEYINAYSLLSSLSGNTIISGDSQVDINQSSIELCTIVDEDGNIKERYYQLFKFNDGCYVEKNNKLSNDGEGILIRKENNEGKYDLAYLNKESLIISGDADVERPFNWQNQYSIQLKKGINGNTGRGEDGTEFYQIYNFDNGCTDLRIESPDDVAKLGIDDYQDGFLFRLYNKETSTPEIRYLNVPSLSNLVAGVEIPPTDTAKFSNVENGQSSIQIGGCADTGCIYYQLYNVDQASDIEQADKEVHIEKLGITKSDDGCSTEIFKKSLLPPNYEFVVRELGDNGCGIIHYMPLSVGVNMPQVDTLDSFNKPSKSIENHFDNVDGQYLELYNFNHPDAVQEYYPNYDGCIAGDKFFIDDRDAILIKKITNDDPENENPELQYMTFKSLKNYINYIGDSNLAGQNDANEPDQYSIELKEYQNQNGNGDKKEYFQLYKFDENNYDVNYIDLTDDYKDISQNGYHFLVRDTDANGQPVLKYKKIYMKSDVDGCVINEIQQSITNIYEQIEIISAEISGIADGCFWQQGADYNTNYGSSIGNNFGEKVITLGYRKLEGGWSADYFYTDSLNVDRINSGCTDAVSVNATLCVYGGCGIITDNLESTDIFGCTVNASSQITIGNTTINEQQLQALLALIS